MGLDFCQEIFIEARYQVVIVLLLGWVLECIPWEVVDIPLVV